MCVVHNQRLCQQRENSEASAVSLALLVDSSGIGFLLTLPLSVCVCSVCAAPTECVFVQLPDCAGVQSLMG